jgi:chondroitin AC lyase
MMAIPNNIFVLSVFFLSLFPILCVTVLLPNDDIAIIRQRVLQLTVWPTPENIPTTVQNALSYSRSLNSSCYWPDIDYSDTHIVVWSTATHMYRITTMLQALTVNGSTVQNDPHIMAEVHCALNVWFMHDWLNPNWWFNQINIPLQATSQLLMLSDNATSLEIEKIKEISYRAAWWLNRSQDVGANLVWMIQCQVYRSLATNNITGIEQGFSRMWQDVAISPLGGEGVQYDWSYHFHGYQLLPGSYGVVWAENILLFLQCSQNTQYQPDDQTLSIFVNFLTKGDAWMLMTDAWDWHVVGRDVGSPGNGFGNKLTTNWIRSVAQLVKSNETRVELLNFADRFDSQPNASLLVGNKHFFISDYQVHRRANFIFTIKMQSIRTQPVECINGQNQKDEHGGQGALNLYRVGFNDYYNLFAIIDWQAINGITVEHDIPIEPCKGGKFDLIPLSFVGGVSDGQYGLAMMDTASHNLTAKRSWHFYDNAVIALATNLTLRTSTTAWTTLASRLLRTGQITVGFFNSTIINLNNGNYSFPYVQGATSNVQWIHVTESNITYVLQLQQQYASLVIQLGTKTGNYDAVGPFYFIVTARMLTVYIDHGIGPYTLDYYYMILPNISRESIPALIRQYNKEQVFACTSTNNSFHGTMWPSLKRASFVLWDNITTTFSCKSPLFEINIQLSDAGAYLFSETETDFTLTASHPIRVNGTVNVIVDRVGIGEGCTVPRSTDARTTNVTLMLPSVPEYLGASVNVTCKK